MRGRVTTEYTVWCALCTDWWRTATCPNRTAAHRIFTRMGWEKRGRVGWVCPRCATKLNQPEKSNQK
jgi:hypothetical protein